MDITKFSWERTQTKEGELRINIYYGDTFLLRTNYVLDHEADSDKAAEQKAERIFSSLIALAEKYTC